MIPKIIHLCWLSGDPYPPKIQFCIDSWKKYLPDYEIMLWDTNRFDVNSLIWTKQAFEKKKYAFAADYIRLFAVYNYGGIYMDSDVEVIKPFDKFLTMPYFVCRESAPGSLELAAFGAEKGTAWVKTAMEYYHSRQFVLPDGSLDIRAQPHVINEPIRNNYEWIDINSPSEMDPDPSKICVLSCDWFGAHPYNDEKGFHYYITENTHSIHHYADSWTSDEYLGGPLHKLFYKLTGINWKFSDRRFKLYGKNDKG